LRSLLVDQEGANGIDHGRDRLVPRECLEPPRHRHDRDVRAGHERKDGSDQRQPLGCLSVGREKAHNDEDHGEHDAVDETKTEGGQAIEEAASQTEPDEEADGGGGDDRPRVCRGVGQGAPKHDRSPRQWPGEEAIGETLDSILGDTDCDAAPGEEKDRRDEARDEVLDVRRPAGVDGAAEHESETEQEHGGLDHGHHEQARCPEELPQGSARDLQGGPGGPRRGVRRRYGLHHLGLPSVLWPTVTGASA